MEWADNILRGNVPLTKLQKEKLKRNKAGLRALTKKSVSLEKKKAILQKGGFLGSLLAPIASVVTPLLSTLFQALVMRCLRIHGLAFCKYTNSLACFFKR
jgi:hypothetical protein